MCAYSPDDWQSQLHGRSATIEEILGGLRSSTGEGTGNPSSAGPNAWPHWLTLWAKEISPKNPAALALRLAWDDVDLAVVACEESEPVGVASAASPKWLKLLRKVVEMAGSNDPSAASERTVAFAEVFAPFVVVASRELRNSFGADEAELLARVAWQTLENDLLAQLSETGSRCLLTEFDEYRQRHRAAIDPTQTVAVPSTTLYTAFCAEVLSDFPAFFLKYGALARQLAVLARFWIDSQDEFIRRLAVDQADLARNFNDGQELGPVLKLEPGLSDRHHAGRQAACLTFAGGLKLLYKPKRLQQETAFAGLLRFLRGTGKMPPENLPVGVSVLARETYGWAAFVAGSQAESLDAVRSYHRKAGVLLGLVHLLGGNDAVMDNLIATREGPVLIDLETFFQPRAAGAASAPTADGPSLLPAKALIVDSVLRTGLLPMWQRGPDGTVYDISGLAGEGLADTGRRQPEWRAVNTDAMQLIQVPAPRPAQQNLLWFDGQPVRAADYLDELAAGYGEVARALVAVRDELLGPDGQLRKLFGGGTTRFLLRPSYVYSVLLHGLTEDNTWRSGWERGISMERLLRPFVQRAEPGPPPALWSLLRRERESLEQGDIPHFPIAVDAGTDLCLVDPHDSTAPALRISGLFAESGLDLAETRLRALDEAAIDLQIRLLHTAFHRPNDEAALARMTPPESRAELEAISPLSADALRECAAGIARQLLAQCIQSGAGAVTWFSPDGLRLEEQTIQGGNFYLYDGNCGVALFLAACSKLGSFEGTEIIRQACQPVAALLASERTPSESRMRGLGVCVGMSSAVYACVRIATFLDDPSYLDLAARIASEITPARIAADETHDIFGGSAGAILALLSLHGATGEKTTLQTALVCGRHLVARQKSVPAGGAAWAASDGRVLTGFAHGAAGIAYALARLSEATGSDEFVDSIRRALAYERALFQPAALNWPMITEAGGGQPSSPHFLNAWCNGAAGIGLARLGLGRFRDAAAVEEIQTAVRKNQLGGLPKVDFLCCGNFGRIGFLHEVALRTDDLTAGDEAWLRAALAIRRSEESGSFSFGVDAANDRCFHPGFFRGVSGIGYELLRLSDPEQIPAVLLFE